MSQLTTDPASRDMASTETLPFLANLLAYLGTATIVSSVASLTDIETGAAHAAGLGTKTSTTTTVTQTVTALQAGHRYRLAITVTDTLARVWTSETTLVCVF